MGSPKLSCTLPKVFWILRTGAPWRDLPPDYGGWSNTHRRFIRWRDAGVWERLLDILIDEPELGLHPFAISLLAEMLKEAAETKQVIVSTQSVELLNHFQPEDVVVVQREGDASVFKRLDTEELADWLADHYSLGELWQRNILGGRPTR